MARIHRAAFTITELLVTVGVIVILLAVLVPSLSKAMKWGSLSHCASNLRQLGAGILAYAADNSGVIPPVSSAGDSLADATNFFAPPRWFSQNGAVPARVSVWNLGYLWYEIKRDSMTGAYADKGQTEGKYLREGKIFFCPAENHEDFTWDTYSAWGSAEQPAVQDPLDPTTFPILKDKIDGPTGKPIKDGKEAVRLPYYYNPVMDNPSAAAPMPLFQRVSEFGGKPSPNWTKGKALLAFDTVEINPDPVPAAMTEDKDKNAFRFKTISHAMATRTANPLGGWNTLLGDGSVRFVTDAKTQRRASPAAESSILEEITAVGTNLADLQRYVYSGLAED